MSDATISFIIVGLTVAAFISNRIPVGIVAIGASLALWATGVLDLNQALAGFGDPSVLFIAALFVVSEGLDATGVTAWAGQKLVDHAGDSQSRLLVFMMLLVAGLTALISVNGAVAALLPVVVVTAIRMGRKPSELLMPLAFGAHAGSMLALTGTPVNVIVSEALIDAGQSGFGFFEFALAGVPLLVGSILITTTVGSRLIPDRTAESMPADLSDHARRLVDQYRVAGSPALERADNVVPISRAADASTSQQVANALVSRESGLAEVVIPPRSPLEGETVFPGMASDNGDLIVLAVQRKGEDTGPDPVQLAVGDTLLLQGDWSALDQRLRADDLLAVDAPSAIRRQAVPLGPGAKRALVVLAAMVLALATGVVPSAVAGLVAACAMILLGVVRVEQAYHAISWTTVVLVAGMMPLSTAMSQTGAADMIAGGLVDLVGPWGPYALVAGLFIITAAFGQLISNMATALIVIPIALAAAGDLGVSIRPLLMSVTVAASAAYLTPVATPVNMMIMGPAGYRFGDYWRYGLPLLVLTFVVAVFLVPLIWPF